ncbi:hypothetical protein D6850_10080 [Roseovarius spongiae]|uniref:Methyltransferase FkbM domain-containing protein n=1 Tax=Roseovarius spongiae TaxID=2320272 RepID=A0A3A8AWR5_9RHOB|nr:FkbM family methyltransferase [Roseovarius spongiae]RKF15180.1 hypothetical protein D6850_10080 [Roseovarius spongiae]
MKRRLRQFKSSAKATARFMRQSSLTRAQVRDALRLLTPYDTGHPLVRIGDPGDGGYLLPDDLDGLVGSYSPGVSDVLTFDLDIMNRGVPTFMADASVDGLAQGHPLAHFDKLFLGGKTGGDVISLDDWVARHGPDTGDLLLQMDIEGAEYETLHHASDATLERFRVVVVEFHSFNRITEPEIFPLYSEVLEKLHRHFAVVHLHPNNCLPPVNVAGIRLPPVFEATFLRRDRVSDATPRKNFPHELDSRNVADTKDFTMPRFWSG